MGSIRFEGVRFAVYSEDHQPPHVHAFYGDIAAVVDLDFDERTVSYGRKRAFMPANAPRSDVHYILELAAVHFDELVALWESIHGNS